MANISIITLFGASFNTVLREKWKNILLHDLVVDEIFEIHSTCSTSGTSFDKHERVAELVLAMCKQLINCNCLPKAISLPLSLAFFEVALEINDFLASMVENNKMIDKQMITYFLHRIILTQYGTIDRKNSVMKICHDSKFEYKFSNEFLIRNCIEKRDLQRLTREVVAEQRALPNQNNLKKTIALIKENALAAVQTMVLPTVKESITIKMRLKYYTQNSIKAVLYEENLEFIKYFYKNKKSATEKNDYLLSLSYYAFKENKLFDASFAVFLYENLDMHYWQDILRLHFCKVFWILAFSCRARPYMLTWYRQAVGTMSCDTFIKLISDKTWNSSQIALHERYTMRNLFKKVWDEAPDTFKEEHLVRQAVIKCIVYIIQNFEVLEHVLRYYDKSSRTQMLRQTILHYIISRPEEEDDEVEIEILNYRKELTEVGANLGLPENTLSTAGEADMRYFILALDGTQADILRYEQQASGFFESDAQFKVHLTKDKDWMEVFLQRHWRTKNVRAIFQWCTCMNMKDYSHYFLRFDEHILEGVYEKVLYEESDLEIGDQGFTSLQLDSQLVRRIKMNVLSKPELRKHLLTSYFRKGNFNFVKQWLVFFAHFNDGIHGFFQEVFSTDYGKAALWELILYIEGSTLKMQQEEQVAVYTSLYKNFASKYSLSQVMLEVFTSAGHPNTWNAPITYQCREPTEQELPELRKVVDFRYRSLLAILHGASNKLPKTPLKPKCVTLTQVSVRLAEAVGLDIPVVY